MIVKSFEIDKFFSLNKIFLFYGTNEGLKNEKIENLKLKNSRLKTYKINEKEILNNEENFFIELNTKSFFDNEKIVIIDDATDKLLKIFDKLKLSSLDDFIIIRSGPLEKKSKLRIFFEKQKELICVPFYPDTNETLSLFANKFFREKKISISQLNINLIINKCKGDREFLKNELNKIELFLYKKKTIETHELTKLINLIENYSISELIDNYLLNNSKQLSQILNENNFNNEDCIIITRTFMAKVKKLLNLANNYAINNNLDKTISEAKPPIFWKEKDSVKLQLQRWKPDMLKKLISNINNIELEIKKNSQSSLNILTNFIFDQILS